MILFVASRCCSSKKPRPDGLRLMDPEYWRLQTTASGTQHEFFFHATIEELDHAWHRLANPLPAGFGPNDSALHNQHGIAVAEEAIALSDRLAIRFPHQFDAGDRGDKHEQSRARQVKIGDQRIDHPATVRRVDE